ncbi:MAG TPA: sugar phosphate isomerase/epimerase [Streptosporangiaceae bacterium]
MALSTASVFPERVPDAFKTAAGLGYDALEVMVTADPVSQDAAVVARLAEFYDLPVVAVHAPNLLLTQRVWGLDPWSKLRRSADMAQRLGAGVVVVHPPFRWQREYAREFETGIVRLTAETGIAFAVENMFPLLPGGAEVTAYAPHWSPIPMDCPHTTLDISHAAVSGSDVLAMQRELGGRLTHLHLGDGTRAGLPDEHLVPGRGTQPCAEVLHQLLADGYSGAVVLEVNTRKAGGAVQRQADLAQSLAFARTHLDGAARAGMLPGRTARQADAAP